MSGILHIACSLKLFIPQNLLLFGLSVLLCCIHISGDNRAILCIAKTPLDTPFFNVYEETNSTCVGCLFPTILRNDTTLQENEIRKYKSVDVIETSSDSVELVINYDDSKIIKSNDHLTRVVVLVSKHGNPTIFTILQMNTIKMDKIIFVACENVTVLADNMKLTMLIWPEWKSQNILSRSTDEFGYITSYTNSAYSSKIILNGDPSYLKSVDEQCNQQTKNVSPVVTCSVLSKQVISGCYYESRVGQSSNDVHIIDVNHNDTEFTTKDSNKLLITMSGIDTYNDMYAAGTSEVNIKRKPLKRNVTLVLCSKEPISLSVHVQNLEGIITFLVGGNDQIENISPSQKSVTISVKKVDLPKSFDLLLIYVLTAVGLPISYIRATSPSVIKMFVPSIRGIENSDALIKTSVAVECSNDYVIVSIPRSIAERVGLAAFSLSDPSCFSKINDSHVFLTSKYNSCGFYLQSRGEQTFYSNVVYVDMGKYSLFETDDEDFEEGSGFGSNQSPSSEIRIMIECKLQDQSISEEGSQKEYNYKMSLYKDESYSVEFQNKDFPVTVRVNSFVHVKLSLITENSLPVNPNLRLLVEKCWLSSSPHYILNSETLIRKSCAVQHFVSIQYISQAVHFQFKLSESVNLKKTQYLHCEIGLCSTNALPKPSIVKCVDPRSYCGKDSLLTAFTNQFIVSKRKKLVIGPLIVRNFTTVLPSGKSHPELTLSHEYEQYGNDKHFFSQNQQPSIIVVEGLSTEAVVGIAILSFLLGIGLMGTLWLIYTKTDPAQQRRPESNVSSGLHYEINANSGASTPSSEVPMTA